MRLFTFFFLLPLLLISFQNCGVDDSALAPNMTSAIGEQALSNKTPNLSATASGSIEKLFVYQGRLENLASGSSYNEKLNSVAEILSNFDILTLTHAFSIGPTGTLGADLVFSYPDYDDQNKFRIANPLMDVRTDFNGDGISDIGDLIALIRQKRITKGLTSPKIFGYVSLTADNINQWPQNQAEFAVHSNYIVENPAGYKNFMSWVNKWKSLEYENPNAYLDGIFLDMASEAYVHEIAIMSMVTYVKNLGYAIMPNVVSLGYTNLNLFGCTKYDASTNNWYRQAAHNLTKPVPKTNATAAQTYEPLSNTCNKIINSIDTFGNLKDLSGNYLMGADDYFLVEGFPTRQGSYLDSATIEHNQKKFDYYKAYRNIGWVTVAQELGYDPNCDSSAALGSASGTTSQGSCQKTTPAVSCSSVRKTEITNLARNIGASAIFYTEANLGVYSNSAQSFCTN